MAARHVAELLNRTLVIVAHPDDETVGSGALLQRMRNPAIVFCTDGGPLDPYFWSAYGSRARYVRVRRAEAMAAALVVGVSPLFFLPIRDQELHRKLSAALAALERLVMRFRPDAILTLAYEGGHPDHDCCAFLSWILGARHRLPVWEMPLYSRPRSEPVPQRFLPPARAAVRLSIRGRELAGKRRMVQAYASQAPILDWFDLSVERFRPQPGYDFRRPPRAAVINYEAWQWPITAADVCSSFSALLQKPRTLPAASSTRHEL